jgi:oleate hydratase
VSLFASNEEKKGKPMKHAENVYIVGSGIASLAAAVYLIKHHIVPPERITIFEAGKRLGGAMGHMMVEVPYSPAHPWRPKHAYSLPATRLLEEHYACTLDLLENFPCLTDTSKTIAQDAIDFNGSCPYDDKARILNAAREVVNERNMGVSFHDVRIATELLFSENEEPYDGMAIEDLGFSDQFFESQFFLAWTTTMGPLRKHSAIEFKRYFQRFLHVARCADTMANIWRMRLNQDDGVARPIVAWLQAKGADPDGHMLTESVKFCANTVVKSVNIVEKGHGNGHVRGIRAESITFAPADGSASHDRAEQTITLGEKDYVFVTLGSQTANMSLGSMDLCPTPVTRPEKAWALWTQLRKNAVALGRDDDFGNPEPFFNPKAHPGETRDDFLSTWVTFTVTSSKPTFLNRLSSLSGNKPWEQGIVTLSDSPWMLSVAPFPAPHFYGQPEDIWAWWGFSLCHDKPEASNLPGHYVQKQVTKCSGSEILEETIRQFRFDADLDDILGSSVCIPCLLPHAGSVWLKRTQVDRPKVVPDGAENFAFLGQFCEIPEDIMFTMEYSVRSAQVAIERLFDGPKPPAVYQGQTDPIAIAAALARFGLNIPVH